MATHKPLLFLDMEGTLFRKAVPTSKGNTAPSLWTAIAQDLGPVCLAEEDATKDRWNAGAYAGYVEWMEETLLVYRKHGLTREIFERACEKTDFHPGVREVFAALAGRFRTALISGGFKAQADRAQRLLRIDHAFAACDLFWDDGGKLEHWNLLPCDYDGKRDFMRLIIAEHGVRPEDCVFIGDGPNDVVLAETVGTSIAFNGHPDLQRRSTHSVRQAAGSENFRDVLPFLEDFLSRKK